jgi:dTDP-glucose 4,6-dehydratase
VPGQVYNIGGGNEVQNLTITHRILELLGKSGELIRYVTDRPGHDRRYAIDCSKLGGLGWAPQVPFEAGLARTVEWYASHPEWWRTIKSGEWREYYARQYGGTV